MQSCNPENGVEFVGGNLFPKQTPNHSNSSAGCCALCQLQPGCEIFTYSSSCWGTQVDCCWLKTRKGAVRQPHPQSISGTTGGAPPLPGNKYRCVDTRCVRDPRGLFATVSCNDTCDTTPGGNTRGGLAAPRFRQLPLGVVQPTGWARRQLAIQLHGLSGHLGRFWPDVVNRYNAHSLTHSLTHYSHTHSPPRHTHLPSPSTWIYPGNRWQETYSDRGGNLPYWLNGIIPLVFQLRPLADSMDSSGYNLTAFVVNYMDTLLENQLREPQPPMYSWFSLGTWNVIRSMMLYMSARPEVIPHFLPFVEGYVQAAQRMLTQKGWPNGGSVCTQCDDRFPACANIVPSANSHCFVRYPDWIWILQQLHDAPYMANRTRARAAVMQHMRLVAEWGADFTAVYSHPCDHTTNRTNLPNCFPTTGCNHHTVASNCKGYPPSPPQQNALITHGVSGVAMPLKEGAVRWRMTLSPQHWQLSFLKLSLLDKYHGRPTGMFTADEYLGGRHPSRGTELCAILETIYSLVVMHQVQGDVSFADRAELVAFNALPAALTANMWEHNYLSTINEIQAVRSDPHLWGEWTDNATIYGLADRFTGVTPCCTANHNQGWPKFFMSTVTLTPGPDPRAIVVNLYAPVSVALPAGVAGKGARVEVVTEYPFGDDVLVVISGASQGVLLRLRVPGWATNASVSVNGGKSVVANPMRYHDVWCGPGNTSVLLALNPEIRVEMGWGDDDSNAVVVYRGALMFALGLDEHTELLHEPWACFESGCSTDAAIRSHGAWAFALVLPPGAPAGQMRVEGLGSSGAVPFANGSSLRIVAQARRLYNWTMDPQFPTSAARPPPSPYQCDAPTNVSAAGAAMCGGVQEVTLVPYGSTRLRVGMFPWTVTTR